MLSRASKRYLMVGDKLPNITLPYITSSGLEMTSVGSLFSSKKSLVIGHPGAFTKFSTNSQVPDFQKALPELTEKFDQVLCLSVNDPFELGHWKQKYGIQLNMLCDFKGDLTRVLELGLPDTEFFSFCCKRTLIIIKDTKVLGVSAENSVQYTEKTTPEAALKLYNSVFN